MMDLSILTERDQRLIEYLKDQGVATATELARRFFPSSNTFYVRASKLRKQGWLESVPFRKNRFGATECLYRLSRPILEQNSETEALSRESMWNHQLALGQLRVHLEQFFPGATYQAEWRCKDPSLTPDLTVSWKNFRVAVELERTRKRSNERYLRKWLEYERSTFTHVFYYCGSTTILKDLSKLARSFTKLFFAELLVPAQVLQAGFGWSEIGRVFESAPTSGPSELDR